MIQDPGLLLTLGAFALTFGILVFVHEMGHYLAGRLFGVKADVFSIGFGPEIGGFNDRRGTRWKLGAFPLGGYVRFAGDLDASSRPDAEWLMLPAEERMRTFPSKPLWQRAIVIAAGPAVNLLLALLILAGFAMAYGVPTTPAMVGLVQPGSAAAAAGLRPDDRIVSLGGRQVETYTDMADYTTLRPGERIGIDYVRGGHAARVDAVIGTVVATDRFGNSARIGRLGIGPVAPSFALVGPFQAPVVATELIGAIVRDQVAGIGQIVTGRRSVDELGGPIRIAKMSGEQASLGLPTWIWWVAMLSINLGFINLLPVPLLDGGHLLFYAIEAVRRRPVESHVQEWAFRGGLAAILALMLVVTFNDLGSFGLWKNLAGLIG
ncbi:MAG: M50 family metallopeptidase [Sphingomonas sp.]